jgi:hypothetical protein
MPGNAFVYGTLMADEVLRLLIHRVPKSKPAALMGYQRHRVKGQVFPAIIPAAPSSKVQGLVGGGRMPGPISRPAPGRRARGRGAASERTRSPARRCCWTCRTRSSTSWTVGKQGLERRVAVRQRLDAGAAQLTCPARRCHPAVYEAEEYYRQTVQPVLEVRRAAARPTGSAARLPTRAALQAALSGC